MSRSSFRPSRRTLVLIAVITALAGGSVLTLAGSGSAARIARWSSSATASPTSVAPGSTLTLSAKVKSNRAASALVDIEVYDAQGSKVFQKAWDQQSFQSSATRTFTAQWISSTNIALGSATVKVGVFSVGWGTMLQWNDAAATITIGSASPVTTTTAPAAATTTTQASTTTTKPTPATLFDTIAKGGSLPSEAECAARVRPTTEVRPSNAPFNAAVGNSPNDLYPRVTGNFTGTTDEIIQWAACKWGINENIVRAQIARESWWDQQAVGDVASGMPSYGAGQVRQYYHGSAFENDNAKRSTAYNLDYTYQMWRSCFDGTVNGASNGYTGWLAGYATGDVWGCVGLWYSGMWHDAGANQYISEVQSYLNQKIWLTPGFAG